MIAFQTQPHCQSYFDIYIICNSRSDSVFRFNGMHTQHDQIMLKLFNTKTVNHGHQTNQHRH